MSCLVSSCQIGAVVVLTLALGACADKGAVVDTACPPTQIAVPSDRVGHSDEQGRLRYVATIEQLSSSCRVEGDHLALDLAFNIKAERGPVFEEQPMKLTYYIATVDPRREIVDKQLLDIELTLQPEQAASIVREELTLHLPASDDATGANYNLYLGFQPDRRT